MMPDGARTVVQRGLSLQILPIPAGLVLWEALTLLQHLVGVGTQIHDDRPVGRRAYASRDVPVNPGEVHLPVVPAHGIQFAALSKVEDYFPRSFFDFSFEVGAGS